MGGRNHIPPPDAAPAPNVAPGREFWTDWEGADVGQPRAPLPVPTEVDLSKPNLSRLALADTLYAQNIAAGQDDATARANADACALVMIP
jgi:hypothetical protein